MGAHFLDFASKSDLAASKFFVIPPSLSSLHNNEDSSGCFLDVRGVDEARWLRVGLAGHKHQSDWRNLSDSDTVAGLALANTREPLESFGKSVSILVFYVTVHPQSMPQNQKPDDAGCLALVRNSLCCR